MFVFGLADPPPLPYADVDCVLAELEARIAVLEEELAMEKQTSKRLENALSAEKRVVRNLNGQVMRLKVKVLKKDAEILRRGRELEAVRNNKVPDMLSHLPPLPRALIEVQLKGCRPRNWSKDSRTLELCLSIFFRSTSAYNQFRKSGFILPHPRTLRSIYSSVLRSVGYCPRLEQMMTIRAQGLAPHEKLVTLSFDGMRLTPGLTYSKSDDVLTGYQDLGQGKSEKFADEGKTTLTSFCLQSS